MTTCFCGALADLSVLSDDPREETRLRRTMFGIEIQCWRLASTIVVPDGSSGGSPSCEQIGMAGAIPHAARSDESTVENVTFDCSRARPRAHDHA